MNLRNLIENIKDPLPTQQQGKKNQQSKSLRRREPQDTTHGKQHSQEKNLNQNSKFTSRQPAGSSRSRDDKKHGVPTNKAIQQRSNYKKNNQTMKIPEKKIIDLQMIREEHSQTSLQIGKNVSKTDPKTIGKYENNERKDSRISKSSSDDKNSEHRNLRKMRRKQVEEISYIKQKTVDIKDRVTRKKMITTDGNSNQSERSNHRKNQRKDDIYSDYSGSRSRDRFQRNTSKYLERESRERKKVINYDSKYKQNCSGVSINKYQKQLIKNNRERSDSYKSYKDRSSGQKQMCEIKKRRVEKDNDRFPSDIKQNFNKTHDNKDFINKKIYDEFRTSQAVKPDVSLKTFLTRNKYSQPSNSVDLHKKYEVRYIVNAYKQIQEINNQSTSQKHKIDDYYPIKEEKAKLIKEKLDKNVMGQGSKAISTNSIKQSENTASPEKQQLVDKEDKGAAKPRSESIGYKGHQTNNQFHISESNYSNVFKIPKSKEHKFSDPMSSSSNHTSQGSQNNSNNYDDNGNELIIEHDITSNQESQGQELHQQIKQDESDNPNFQETVEIQNVEKIIDLQPDQNYTVEAEVQAQLIIIEKIVDYATKEIQEKDVLVPETSFDIVIDKLKNNPISQVQPKKLSLLTECEKEKLNSYIFTINNFISVSKLVLNRFVVYLQFIKDSYLQQMRDTKPELLKILNINKEQFCQKTQVEFIKVIKCMMAGYENVKDFENVLDGEKEQSKNSSTNRRKSLGSQVQNKEMKVNFTSIKHCIKRIQKACQMQIDDFQQKNGIYKEEILLGSIQDDQLNEQELNEFLMNKKMLRERMELLMYLIEIEQVSKQYLELFKRNFILLYELVKHDVMDIIFQDQINNQIDSGSDFEEHMRTRAYYIKYSNFQQFNQANFDIASVKNINSSIIDIFTSDELQQISSSTTLLVSLMEIGNTVDSVTIISKILDKKQNLIRINADCFDKFLIWKKRKCHCCMEYILDGGKAVTCVNIIQEKNPCKNIYCQNCVVAYIEQNSNLSMGENNEDKEKVKDQKDKEIKKHKHKLWLKAQQNILFICPCCQGVCLIEDKQKQKNLDFAKYSICNFNHRILNYPNDFLKKEFYWSRLTCNKRKFQLAKVIGVCKPKNIYKVELLSTSQIYQIKLQKEEIFFTDSVRNGSKLFKIINSEGFELDLKNIIDKQVKDFDNHSTYSILEKYKNYVDKPDQLNNGFIIPKFNYVQVQYRPEFVLETRNLMKRYDNQLFDSFELELRNICHNHKDQQDQGSIFNNSEEQQHKLQVVFQGNSQEQLDKQQNKPMILRQIKETDYRKLNNKGTRMSDDVFEMIDTEPEKHFKVEKSVIKGTAKTPFDRLKIEKQNIKNTPYELTMEPVNRNASKDSYGNEDMQPDLEQFQIQQQNFQEQLQIFDLQNHEISVDQEITKMEIGEHWKEKQRHQILNNYQVKENNLADQMYRLSHPNIGAMLVQEKNIQFAQDEMNRRGEDQIQLLVNRQVFRIERQGDQSNYPNSLIDAIGEIKDNQNPKPSTTYEGQPTESPYKDIKFDQNLFEIERGASREQYLQEQMIIEYDQPYDQQQEEEDQEPQPEQRGYKIRKIGDSAVIIYDFDNAAEKNPKQNIRRKRSISPKLQDEKDDQGTEQKQIESEIENAQSISVIKYNVVDKEKRFKKLQNDEEQSFDEEDFDLEGRSRSRSGNRNAQSQKQLDATFRKQEKARIQREKLKKEDELLLKIQEEQRDIRLAKREEIKRINIFNQIQKKNRQAAERKRLRELNGQKSEEEDDENDEDEERQVKSDEEMQETKHYDNKEDEKSLEQQQKKVWKKPKVHADKMMQQSFLANQQNYSLIVDRQKPPQETDTKGNPAKDSQDYDINDLSNPFNRQQKEAIIQYSDQQKLFTQQHKASPTKIIKNRIMKEKGERVNQVDLDYLKALEICEKKEYNLRAGRQKSPMDAITKKAYGKAITLNQQQQQEKAKADESEEPSAPIETKITTRITRGANREQKETKESKEEFYDDFPIEIIKKYNLKISKARREEIYQSRRTRKSNQKQPNEKPVVEKQNNQDTKYNPGMQNQGKTVENNNIKEEKDEKMNYKTKIKQKESAENQDKTDQSKSDKPNYDKLYLRRFVMRPKVEEHHQKLHQIVLTNPLELIGFYIYIYRKSQNLWRRAFIKNYFPGDESKRIYEIEYQNEAKLVKQINILKVIFIIDYSSESPKNSQDLSKLSKQSQPKSEGSNGKPVQNEDTRKSLDKLKNYGLYNNKKRVYKMLQKIEDRLEKEESKKDSVKQEDGQNSSFSKLSSLKGAANNGINLVVSADDADIDQKQADDKKVQISQDVIQQEENHYQDNNVNAASQEEKAAISTLISEAVEEEQKEEQLSQIIAYQTEIIKAEPEIDDHHQIENRYYEVKQQEKNSFVGLKRSKYPKQEWIKDMKQKLLSKTRQSSSNQKILKFYHQEIEIDDDFSKSGQSQTEQQKIFQQVPVDQSASKSRQNVGNQSIFPPQNCLKNNTTVSFNLQNNPNDLRTNQAQKTQNLQEYELQLQQQQQNLLAQKQVHDSQNEKINNMIIQINSQGDSDEKQVLPKNIAEVDSYDFNSAGDMVQQKLLLSRLQQKSYLIDEQKQKYKEQIQQLYALDLDKPENKDNRKIFEQLTYEFEQYCIMQQFMDQIYQQQIQAYFMRQQLDERSLDHKNSGSKGAVTESENQKSPASAATPPCGPQIQEQQELIIDKNEADDDNNKFLAAQLEQYNQFQQIQIEYASKSASQQMMNQFYNEKNNYLLMNQVLSAEYLLNLKQQYANDLLQEDQLIQQQVQKGQENVAQNVDEENVGGEEASNVKRNKSNDNEENEFEQTWDQQYSYIKQIQKLLDRVSKLNDIKEEDYSERKINDLDIKTTFNKIDEGIKDMEQNYNEEKVIEQEIISILNLENLMPSTVPDLLNQFKNEESENQIVDDQPEEPKVNPEEDQEEDKVDNKNNDEEQEDSNKQQNQQEGSEIKPEFFFEHINYLAELKKKQQATIALNFQMRENDDREKSMNDEIHQQIQKGQASNMQHLQEVVNRFLQKQIVFNGFKQCKCQACFKMVNPLLIKYDAESNEYLLQHQQQYASFNAYNQNSMNLNQNIGLDAQLRYLFTFKKTDLDIQNSIKQIKDKINKSKQIQEKAQETDKEEYLQKYPCFKILVKRITEEEDISHEKTDEVKDKAENNGKDKNISEKQQKPENLLPKLAQVFPENIKPDLSEFCIDKIEKQFEEQVKLVMDEQNQKDNAREVSEQDVVIEQVKLDLMRTMQKMLVQFKLMKQLQKPKFDKNFGRVLSQGNKKLKNPLQKKRQSKESQKLAEKQKRIEMQNYINSLYRNQYLGQRFGDDENKIWDYTTIQAPGAINYNNMMINGAPNQAVSMVNVLPHNPVDPAFAAQNLQMNPEFNYGAPDMYYSQQQATMMRQNTAIRFPEEMAAAAQFSAGQPRENPYMFQNIMGTNFNGAGKPFVNGSAQPVYNINTFANGGDNHISNYNSNFNNCQIFQPQIINQNYLTTIPPQQHNLPERLEVHTTAPENPADTTTNEVIEIGESKPTISAKNKKNKSKIINEFISSLE